MKLIFRLIGIAAVATLANSGASAQSLSIVAGSTCAGATSATFTVGTPVTVSVCAITPAASTCGASIQFVSASAAQNDLFRITSRTRGASFDSDNNATYTFGANTITTPANAQDFGASAGTPAAAASGVVVATFDITPQAGATASSYTISLGGVSSVLATSSTCGAATETTSTPSFTLNSGTSTTPTVSIGAAPATLVDAAANVSTVTVTASSAAPAGGLVVNLTPAAANARYSTTCGATITIPAGSTTATCTVTATVNTTAGDGSVVATTALGAAGAGYTVGAPASAAVTINDDDVVGTPSVSIAAAPATLVDAAANVSTVTVTSSAAAPAGGLVVNLTPAAANARYSTTCGATITIAAGSTTATCTVTATPNTTSGDGSVIATTALGAAGAGYTVGAPASAAVTINDDDAAQSASISAAVAFITEGNTATFTLSCTGAGTFAIPYTVNTIAGDGAPAPASPANLTCGTPLNITVATSDNAVVGDTRNLTLTLGALPGGLVLSGPGAATVVVQDNDGAAGPVLSVPTIGTLGLGLMSLLIAGFGAFTQRRRK